MTIGCSRTAPAAARDVPQPTVAAALAFAPPAVARLGPEQRLDLDFALARYGRGPQSLLGYDTPTVETYYLRVDDRLGAGGSVIYDFGYGPFWRPHGFVRIDWYEGYQRRAITTRHFERVRPPGR